MRALAGLPALTGLVLAKTEDAAHVAAAAGLVGLGDVTALLMPLLETAGRSWTRGTSPARPGSTGSRSARSTSPPTAASTPARTRRNWRSRGA